MTIITHNRPQANLPRRAARRCSTFRVRRACSLRELLRLTVGLLLACSLSSFASAADVEIDQWPLPRGNAESTGYSPQQLPAKLRVRWEFKADEAIETTPVIAQGRVFVSDVMGQIYAVRQSDGGDIWRKNYDTGFLASPAVNQGLLVIGDIEGNLYGLDAATGEERWKQTTEAEINGAAAFHEGKVLVTSQDGKLYCFHAKDGSPAWTYQTDDQIRCTPTLAGDRTFLGGCDGQLHVVDVKTGKAAGEPLPARRSHREHACGPWQHSVCADHERSPACFRLEDFGIAVAIRGRRPATGIPWQCRDFRFAGRRQQPIQRGGCDLDEDRPAEMAAYAQATRRCVSLDRRRRRLDRGNRREAGPLVA